MSSGRPPGQKHSLKRGVIGGIFVDPGDLYPPDVVAWMKLSPAERLSESAKLWDIYKLYGGTFEPDPDPQSPFFDPEVSYSGPSDGGTGLRFIRRSGV